METKTKLLIAVGAAFNSNCQPCLRTIIKKALDSGADKKELTETIAVARIARKNAMTQIDRFATGLAEIEVEQGSNNSCGCTSSKPTDNYEGGEKND